MSSMEYDDAKRFAAMNVGGVNVCLLLSILDLAIRYGVPMVKAIVAAWDKPHITSEDIDAMAHRLKKPEEYLPPKR